MYLTITSATLAPYCAHGLIVVPLPKWTDWAGSRMGVQFKE